MTRPMHATYRLSPNDPLHGVMMQINQSASLVTTTGKSQSVYAMYFK